MILRILIVSLTLLSSVGLLARVTRSESTPMRTSFTSFPMQIGEWQGRQGEPFDAKIMKVLGVDEYVNIVYYQPRQAPVGLYVGYYQSQRQGDAIHSPMNCLPGAGWQPVSGGTLTMSVDEGGSPGQPAVTRSIEVNRYVIQKGLDRQLVLYWYQSQGRVIASEYSSKAFMIWDAVRANRTDAALVRVITPIVDDAGSEKEAEARAVTFVQSLFPQLGTYIPS